MKNRLVAHRGDMTQYIENTLPAVRAAVDLNMSWIEIDIQVSRDGVPIVVHDNKLTRIATRNQRVTDTNAAELLTFPITLTARNGSAAQLPTLVHVGQIQSIPSHWQNDISFC